MRASRGGLAGALALAVVLAGCGAAESDERRLAGDNPVAAETTVPGETTTAPPNLGVASSSDNEAHPPQDDVVLTECVNERFGPIAKGTLTNPTSKQSSYMITVQFLDAAGVIVADGTGYANDIPSGATALWDAHSFEDDVSAAGCNVVRVERYSAVG